MARKLPWATAPSPSSKRPSNPPPEKHEDEAASTKSSARAQTSLDQGLVKPTRRQRTSRTPSTAPPPGPPNVEPMREGYEEDDTWIMVEDELQALAQTFTAHLHHAEYKRLMRKARSAPKLQLPEPTSPMSSATTQKLKRKALEQRQSDGLDQVMPRINGSGSEELADENVEDPWRGTSLAGLMAAGSQEKRSLKGLEKLPSSTRAAKGYRTTVNGNAEGSMASQTTETRQHTEVSRNSSFTSKEPRVNVPPEAPGYRSQETSYDDMAQATESRHRKDGSMVRRKLLKQAFDDTIDDQSEVQSNIANHQGPLKSFKKKKVKEESKEDRLAEVPMFII